MATSNKWQFSEEEIRAKLEELGYNNIPDKALKEFSNDLHKLISSENVKETIHHRHSISSTSSTFYSPATTSSDQSIHGANVDDDQKRVTYKTVASYSDDESSFEQSPVTQHRRPHTYASADKENQAESRNPTSLRATQKRKVLRKKNGEAHVFDESFNQENATDISDVEKRLQKLPLKDDATDLESIDDDMSERSSVLQPWGRNRNALPSFIRPRTVDPRSKGIRKTDPVSR
ncbi:Hypothetical predicted protein [Paramuricea clavata]|nr:Hypothetical predicted protein [Paramuricea clavata]